MFEFSPVFFVPFLVLSFASGLAWIVSIDQFDDTKARNIWIRITLLFILISGVGTVFTFFSETVEIKKHYVTLKKNEGDLELYIMWPTSDSTKTPILLSEKFGYFDSSANKSHIEKKFEEDPDFKFTIYSEVEFQATSLFHWKKRLSIRNSHFRIGDDFILEKKMIHKNVKLKSSQE